MAADVDVAALEAELVANGYVCEEWRVTGMPLSRDRTENSSFYYDRSIAERVLEARGGRLQRRVVARTDWKDV